jgi:folate-binding protein YgfZ
MIAILFLSEANSLTDGKVAQPCVPGALAIIECRMTLTIQSEAPSGERGSLGQELCALAAGCGAYRIDRALVSLTGKDRVRWLNGMVSNNIRDLAVGGGVYGFALNPQGHIQGDLYAFNRGEDLILEVDRSQPDLLPQLRRYIIMDKVEVEELGDSISLLGIAGPAADKTLASIGIAVPGTAALAFTETTWNGATITVVRGDNPCVPNYEFWVPSDAAKEFWASLLRSSASGVYDPALEAFRILCGIPKVGVDIRDKTLPQETGQDRALNFTKGCYIGQEIVERIRARGAVHRVLTGFEVTGEVPPPGTSVLKDGKEIGLITSVARVPTGDGEHLVAIGFLRKEHIAESAALNVGRTTLHPVQLPFLHMIGRLRGSVQE